MKWIWAPLHYYIFGDMGDILMNYENFLKRISHSTHVNYGYDWLHLSCFSKDWEDKMFRKLEKNCEKKEAKCVYPISMAYSWQVLGEKIWENSKVGSGSLWIFSIYQWQNVGSG